MKYIVAIIQPDRLDEVLDLLTEKEIHLVTVSNVMGRGRQKEIVQDYRNHTRAGNLLRKVKLEIAVNDEFADAALTAVEEGARTGQIGDGKIFVLDLESSRREFYLPPLTPPGVPLVAPGGFNQTPFSFRYSFSIEIKPCLSNHPFGIA